MFVSLFVIGMPAICDRNASQTPIDFLPLAAAPPYGKYDFFSIVLHSPSRDLVHRRKNFAGGRDGVPLELMAFVECGPSGLSSLLRFRVFSSKSVQATLTVIGKGWVNKFWGSGGLTHVSADTH